jgi:hypothetical protein
VSSSVRRRGSRLTLLDSSGSFYRQAIPEDITNGQSPNPSTWIEPVAQLSPSGCDPLKYFYNHSIIFGQSCSPCILVLCSLVCKQTSHFAVIGQATRMQLRIVQEHARRELWTRVTSWYVLQSSTTCADLIFYAVQNASWSINSLKVYQKISLTGKISGAERTIALDALVISLIACLLVITFAGL